MEIDLSGKTAFISGSTSGIGLAIARGLGQSGAAVVVNGSTQAAGDRAVAALQASIPSAKVRGVAADMGTADGCHTLVEREPTCDILVNSVGIYGPQDFFDTPDCEWTKYFEINVMPGVRLSRAYLPALLARNWGRVVFLSSEHALNTHRTRSTTALRRRLSWPSPAGWRSARPARA